LALASVLPETAVISLNLGNNYLKEKAIMAIGNVLDKTEITSVYFTNDNWFNSGLPYEQKAALAKSKNKHGKAIEVKIDW